ncbi:MAG: (d)CMP kinase [Chloroflexota bacterium]
MPTPNDLISECDPPFHITIDGPAGAGKSTVGGGLARALGCPMLDTGLMYRAVTHRALEEHVGPTDAPALAVLARSLQFDLIGGSLSITGVPAGELHSRDVDDLVSTVSAHPEVRQVLVEKQREFASGQSMVMVGRDIGTVVLPRAAIKLWITASSEVRAQRRRQERDSESISQTPNARRDIGERDTHDSTRRVSPLRPAGDAVAIDTSGVTADQAVDQALAVVQKAMGKRHEQESGVRSR